MLSPLFLGLDFGTSGARACAIAGNGEIEEFARIDFGDLAPHEQATTWRTILLDLLAGLPVGLRKRLAAIALDATSSTVLVCDETLTPTHPPLLYDDARARQEAADIGVVAGTGHPAAVASSGLAKVLWLSRHLAAERRRLFLNQADWLAALLSGRPGISDYHNALKMGHDPALPGWPAWVDRLVDRQALPSVVPPGSGVGLIAGPRGSQLGIDSNCLIRAGTTDSIAAFLASGASQSGDAVTCLGSTLVLKLVSMQRIDDAGSGVYSHWFGTGWLTGGASNAGGGILRDFFDDAELAALSGRIDPETDSGLRYYPLRRPGERFPVNDPDLAPCLLPRPTEPERFLHGLLEGLARIEAAGYRRLVDLGATPARRIISSGGGSSNRTFARLRERQLGLVVKSADHTEAAYGAARLALHGTCLFPGACDA